MPQLQGREPGVYVNLSMQDYHNDPAIGSSGIKKLLVSEEAYWAASPLNPDREPFDTAAFKVGRAYHSMVLEPEKPFPFEIKRGVKSSKVEGMIGEGDYHMLELMYARLLKNPKHWNSLHGGMAEASIFWRDKATGLMCKIRPDNFAAEYVSDLKTCQDVHKGLRYDFVKRGYHISGTMYSIGVQALKEMIRDGYQMPVEFGEDFVKRLMAREKQMFCFVFQEKPPTSGEVVAMTTRLWNMTPYISEIGHEKFIKGMCAAHDLFSNERNIATKPLSSGYPDIEDITEDMVSAAINY